MAVIQVDVESRVKFPVRSDVCGYEFFRLIELRYCTKY